MERRHTTDTRKASIASLSLSLTPSCISFYSPAHQFPTESTYLRHSRLRRARCSVSVGYPTPRPTPVHRIHSEVELAMTRLWQLTSVNLVASGPDVVSVSCSQSGLVLATLFRCPFASGISLPELASCLVSSSLVTCRAQGVRLQTTKADPTPAS